MMEMTRVRIIEHIKKNVQLEREVSELKQQVRVGVSKLFLSFYSVVISILLTNIGSLIEDKNWLTPCDCLQMAGVTRANLIKHMNKNKQLEREIMELKQQVRAVV